MTDEKDKELSLQLAKAWDKHLEKLSEKERANILNNYKKYIEEYSKFVCSQKIIK